MERYLGDVKLRETAGCDDGGEYGDGDSGDNEEF